MDSSSCNDTLLASLNSLNVGEQLLPDQFDRALDEFLVDSPLSASAVPNTFDPYPFDDLDWSLVFTDTASVSTSSVSSAPNTSYSPPVSPSSSADFDSFAGYPTASSSGQWLVNGAGSALGALPPFQLGDNQFDFEYAGSGASQMSDDLEQAQRMEHEYLFVPESAADANGSESVERPCLPSSPLDACKRERSSESDVDSEKPIVDEKVVTKKPRRRQDTTPHWPCPHPGCRSVFARTHNLKVHIETVHKGARRFVCDVADCQMAFGRRHDLHRHNISKHTDQGSPRKKTKTKVEM
ncbi:hypothetical protein PYCCODRAFT_1105316 [Trametes coccinea BRFM310]|uniref:C2H2-type domain-containing protein n=1 Tax=Trametes coccinea (strain BRFM310) TaxID=1353009 RepID=A0A1Y2I9K0_TRAC3|nr:hypothetical protein PYCCODRAFT_1105316 [Trametes coccinea BRFM310]